MIARPIFPLLFRPPDNVFSIPRPSTVGVDTSLLSDFRHVCITLMKDEVVGTSRETSHILPTADGLHADAGRGGEPPESLRIEQMPDAAAGLPVWTRDPLTGPTCPSRSIPCRPNAAEQGKWSGTVFSRWNLPVGFPHAGPSNPLSLLCE